MQEGLDSLVLILKGLDFLLMMQEDLDFSMLMQEGLDYLMPMQKRLSILVSMQQELMPMQGISWAFDLSKSLKILERPGISQTGRRILQITPKTCKETPENLLDTFIS
ncbi:hypothetical protein CEXT_432101 [Caerostris extrusa]|uniref:Uncharacterized protein n=1 Tax=Caerostris extrusa TaxID=172846 RepID=A0AAV4RM90_CAEEX|nr:hypothetical protein CEXT_432101 [Caerostris extrusa]